MASKAVFIVFCCLQILSFSFAEDVCYKDNEEEVHCFSEDAPSISISCPVNFMVRIEDFTHRQTDAQLCPTDDDVITSCEIEYLGINPLMELCDMKQSCEVPYSALKQENCMSGRPALNFTEYSYHCEPTPTNHQHTVSDTFCGGQISSPRDATIFEWTSPQLSTVTNEKSRTQCGVTVTLPKNTEIRVEMNYFLKNHPSGVSAGMCDQHVLVWDDRHRGDMQPEGDASAWGFTRLCQERDTYTFSCFHEERTMHIMYVTNNKDVSVIFSLKAFIHVRRERDLASAPLLTNIRTSQDLSSVLMPTMDFGTIDDPFEPPNDGGMNDPSTDDTTSPAPVTEAKDEAWKLPVLIAMIGIGLLAVVIVILLIYLRHRNYEQRLVVEEKEAKANSPYTFVTDIYLEGDNSSKLTLDKKANNQQI